MIKAQTLNDARYRPSARDNDVGKDGSYVQFFTWVAVAVCMIGLGLLELTLVQADSPEYAETTFGVSAE